MIDVTPKAVEKIRAAFAKEGVTEGGLRLGVLGGGCSGLSYQFKFDPRPRPTDNVLDYSGVRIVQCQHERLKAADDCPASCGGRLYDLKEPTALLQFTGQPLITATKFEREALRCAKCQQRYVAPLPEGVKEERYDATCDATIALMRYGGGLP